MKKMIEVSSLAGKSVVVYGRNFSHRKEFIEHILSELSGRNSKKILVESLDVYPKSVSIEQMRSFLAQLRYSSISASSLRVFISYHSDTLSHLIQNTMLKTLEELSPSHVFILEAASLDALIPTIQSRSVLYYIGNSNEPDNDISQILNAPLPELFSLAEDLSQDAESAHKILIQLIQYSRQQALVQSTSQAQLNYIDYLLKNYEVLQTTNASVRLVLENCFLGFYSVYKQGV